MLRLLLLWSCTVPPLALAGEDTESAQQTVETKLVAALQAKDKTGSRFSRKRPPPMARRVRMLEVPPEKDSAGATFLSFAIDTQRGFADDSEASWRRAEVSGCVYPVTGQVFVVLGDKTFPAEVLLGKKVDPVKVACRAARS